MLKKQFVFDNFSTILNKNSSDTVFISKSMPSKIVIDFKKIFPQLFFNVSDDNNASLKKKVCKVSLTLSFLGSKARQKIICEKSKFNENSQKIIKKHKFT
jgi:hypothetical protein